MNRVGREVAVVGVGYSDVTRRGEPDIRTMTRDAALDALADAGLVATDLDAIFEYSFGMMRGDSPIAVGAQRLLGVPNLTAFNDIMGTGPSGLASAMDAAMAIAAGACETALVYRTITREAGHNGGLREGPTRAPGQMQFAAPYGYGGGIILAMAMKKRRRIAELGGSVEDYGQIALNARRWAALYPRAMFREPITMDDYLDSRVVADPLVLFDCDYPVNAACAAILTTAERAADLRQPAVLVDALAYGTGSRPDWLYTDDFLFGGTIPCARRAVAPVVGDGGRRRRRRAVRRLHAHRDLVARGPRAVRHRRVPRLGRRRRAHRARWVDAAQHLRRPARRRTDARARVPERGGAPGPR